MPPSFKCPSISSSVSICTKPVYRSAQSRSFSASSHNEYQRATRARSRFWRWLGGQGNVFRNPPAEGHTNYLGAYTADGQLKRVVEAGNLQKENKDKKHGAGIAGADTDKSTKKIPDETTRDLRPFPLNPHFVSQPVLSDEMKDKIWYSIMVDGLSVRDSSTKFEVEMSRIGAVVRLKEIEKEWVRIGKPLATPYANAVISMLPVTQYEPDAEKRAKNKPHESINDLPIHPATGTQIFHPTSESRVFTRADAAKVFDDNLLPADDRVPHPELALQHKDYKSGMTAEEISDRQAERDAEIEVRRLRLEKKKRGGSVKAIDTRRWEFRFTDINVDKAGKDGRGPHGVGWRYGMPLMDRKRSQVKIPTRVE